MTDNEAIARLREMSADPKVKAAMFAAWNAVIDELEPYYLAKRPKMKSFEVHHSNEVARACFAQAVVAGEPWEHCTRVAIERVKPV